RPRRAAPRWARRRPRLRRNPQAGSRRSRRSRTPAAPARGGCPPPEHWRRNQAARWRATGTTAGRQRAAAGRTGGGTDASSAALGFLRRAGAGSSGLPLQAGTAGLDSLADGFDLGGVGGGGGAVGILGCCRLGYLGRRNGGGSSGGFRGF